jgi:hypothetical protein
MAAQVIPIDRRKHQREGIMRQMENAYAAFRKCGGNIEELINPGPAAPGETRLGQHSPGTSGLFLISRGATAINPCHE